MSDPNDGRRAFLIQTAANVDHLVRLNFSSIKNGRRNNNINFTALIAKNVTVLSFVRNQITA